MADGGLPPRFEVEFSTLGSILESAAQRQGRRISELSNVDAAVLLQQQQALGEKHAKEVKTSADQFLRAAEMPPRGCKSRMQRTLYEGNDGRMDAKKKKEHAWWKYWVHTPTPVGLRSRAAGVYVTFAVGAQPRP